MRKVREVLRLRHALSLSYREIGEALGVSKTAAGEIVRRAEVIGLSWPLPQLFDDGEVERRLFTAAGEAQTERPAPDWAKLHEELKRRRVTPVLPWQTSRGTSRRLPARAITGRSPRTRSRCSPPRRRGVLDHAPLIRTERAPVGYSPPATKASAKARSPGSPFSMAMIARRPLA